MAWVARAGRVVLLVASGLLPGGWAAMPLRADEPNPPAAEFSVTSWHTENGLPDGNITAIQQTPDGYLWIGTPRGLARFDGVNFTVYDSRKGTELLDESITGLLSDRRGRLWVGCGSGALLRWENGQFKTVRVTTPDGKQVPETMLQDPEFPSGRSTHSRRLRVSGLADDADGAVWFQISRSTLVRAQDGEARIVTVTNGLPGGPLFGLVPDSAGQPWLLAGASLFRRTNGQWVNAAAIGALGNLQPVFCPAREGGMWIAAPISSWSTGGGRVTRFNEAGFFDLFDPTPWATNSPRSQVTAVLEDRSHRVWLGTHWGGVLFSDAAGHWQRPQREGVLTQCRVTALFEDQQGAVWVGTLGDGLHRLTQRPVTTLHLPEPAKEHLVMTVCAARDGSVWVGTDGAGAFRYRAGGFTHYGEAEGLGGEMVFSIFEDRQTNLWCGTGSGLRRFEDGRFESMKGSQVPSGPVLALFEDRTGVLWIGTPRGAVSRREGEFVRHPLFEDQRVSEIRSFAQDAAGNIWVGTIAQGLFCLRSNRIERYRTAEGLLNQDARSIWCDTNGGVWVGTLGGGLFRLADGRFHAITTADGLPDDTINSILEDSEGNLWMSSYNGYFGCSRELLARYQRGRDPTLVCRWLSLSEGLDFRACSGAGQPVASQSADGRIWFINQRNLAVFNPGAALGPQVNPNVLVEAVVVDGTEIPARRADEIRVPSSARRFEFRYTALNLTRPEEARFRHRLAGLDAEWIEAGSGRMARYSRLSPGEYQFEVMAAGGDGRWHPAVAPLPLSVVPRFWERTSLRVLGGCLVIASAAGVAFLISRARLKRRLLLLEMKQATERERRRIAQDLHDDLGGSLTEIGILAAAADGDSSNPASEPGPMTQVRAKSDELVRALDEIVWAVNPRHDSAASLAEYLSGYAQDFLRVAGIRTRVNLEGPLATVALTPEQRHGLFLAAKEALNNVVRHAQATQVRLHLQVRDGRLEIRIEDDGRGFDPAHLTHAGDGLRNLRERLRALDGVVVLRSEPGQGTTVELSLPLI